MKKLVLLSDFIIISEFSEELKSKQSSEYDIRVLMELNYEYPSFSDQDDIDMNLTLEDAQARLPKERKRNREYFEKNNNEILKDIDLSKYAHYVSKYSPYVELLFNDYDDYLNGTLVFDNNTI